MTNKEFKKYRKNALKEIHYQHVYSDGVIETEQGYFTKSYFCCAGIMSLFDFIYNLHAAQKNSGYSYSIDTELTYYNKAYYLTIGTDSISYDEALRLFTAIDFLPEVKPMPFMDRMNLLHAMYQNEDSVEERYNKYGIRKKDVTVPSDFALCMKNFKKNGKCSKDLVLPFEMKTRPTEMEFEGNYVRFFYLKNMPRYLTKEFMEDLMFVDNVLFSIHLKPLSQKAIADYAEIKFESLKDLKDTELLQKQFFEAAVPELRKSEKRNELMFLTTLVLGIPDDSIDELDEIFARLVRKLEETYVLKELKFQQKDALRTILPFCDEKLDIQTTIYKMRETGGAK